ncbi:acyltransferase family protein [Alkalibacterium putridalgicola]|uniref:acyltransferase family protein n=1 Tax=Alkalibacterium putridalgicola TaxID=426703 RepID=UPI0034CEAB1B
MAKRNYTIDIIKALAIISVILIHGLSNATLYDILAPYYIWQTVPVFMILMGYNAANSFMRKGYENLPDILARHYLLNKAERILLPFGIIWLMQVLIQFFYFENRDIGELLLSFVEGGYGPGSYFIPLLIQATILIPFIYLILKKQPTKMMILLFFVSLLIDLASFWLNISGSLYRILIIRHLFSVTLGIWYALEKSTIKLKWLVIPAIASLAYITAVHYYNWELIVEEYWHSQHAPSYFYVLFIIMIGMKHLEVGKESLLEKFFILIGQASLHIYLTQMFYFWFLHERLPDFSGFMYLLMFLTIPIASGIGFYLLDGYLNRKVIKK